MTDPVRVGIVEEAIDGLAAVGRTRAHAWAVAIVTALDAFDADRHSHRGRTRITFSDETDADDGSDSEDD